MVHMSNHGHLYSQQPTGIGQTGVALARLVGPTFGGTIFSWTEQYGQTVGS